MSDDNFQSKIRALRESTGLNRKEFCKKFGIPYRTMTEWELGQRNAPPYVLRLLTYYVRLKEMSDNRKTEGALTDTDDVGTEE